MSPAQREMQQLLAQLSAASDALMKNAESAESWQYQLRQADLLLHIASRSERADQDHWLRMAVESYHAASVQSPPTDQTAYSRLMQLPGQIRQHFPASKLATYAALMEVRADHLRQLGKEGMDRDRAEDYLHGRLLRFAAEHPKAPEAIESIREVARGCEARGKTEVACRCHRLLADNHPGTDVSRQARAALRRLGGMNGEPVCLALPQLYPLSAQAEEPFDLKELAGKVLLVHFWAGDSAAADEGFDAIKRAMDRCRSRGLDAVHVNMDGDVSKARQHLSGRLTCGTHLHLKDGLKHAVAERYGLDKLPVILLVGRDGRLLRHSVSPADVESVVSEQLPAPVRGR